MIWVLLQSESPWQRNDAITFFIYRYVSLYQEFFVKIQGKNSLLANMQIQLNLLEAPPILRVTSSFSLQVRSVRFLKCAPREE